MSWPTTISWEYHPGMGPRHLVLGVLTILTIILAADRAHACSCMGGIPLCETVWKTDVVFSGEVLDISPVPNPHGEGFQPHRRVRFRVLQGWRGETEPTVELTTGAGGGDCGYNFEKGVAYLVFAHSRGGALTTGICSRTRRLADAAEDLEYLKTAMRPSATGRIFGAVQYQREPNSTYGPLKPAPGYPVELSDGKTTRKTSTDRDGRYEFTGVVAGTYAVTVTPASAERVFGQRSVTLADPRGCAAADFSVVPDGRISVRVLDGSGVPRPNLSIDLIDVEAVVPGRPYSSASWVKSDAAGRIEWEQLHPRRYVLAVNATRPPNAQQPYPTTFFPGVSTLAEAAATALVRGERVDLGDWTLPDPLAERRIVGTVTWPDGKPAAGARIHLWGSRNSAWSGRQVDGADATADQNGRFTLLAHEGIAYRVTAYLNVNEAQWSATIPEFSAGAPGERLDLVLRTRVR